MNTTESMNRFYANCDEDARLRSRHGMVEFLTTMHYIEKYLHPDMRILEIGAGTGRYSHTLAQKGYRVDAVELVDHNIEIFRSNTQPDEQVTIVQGNALDLSCFESDCYDIVLLLGPMYHLFTEEEQLQALREAIRVARPDGVIFAAYCNNDATIIQFCFQRGMIREKPYCNLIDPVTFKASSTPEEVFQLYRREDVDALMSHFDAERLHYIGTDMATGFMRACVDEMDDELFEIYMRYHLTICERPDMVGATHHMLDVFRKKQA